MRSIPILIIALIIAVIVPNVCAENVTYSQEYYDLNTQANELWAHQLKYNDYNAEHAIILKLNAIQIALEKQNELINEQNELLKKLLNQTYTTQCVYGTCSKYNVIPGYSYNN